MIDKYLGKRFSLWLVDTLDENVIYGGWIAQQEQGSLVLVRAGGRFPVEDDWMERIQPVTNEEARTTLQGADFYIKLTVGPLPGSEKQEEQIQTGMTWPKSTNLARDEQ